MPVASGQYVLNDFVAELQAMGFDGFSPADLATYVNRGYFHVARKNRWYWEQTTDAFTVSPGSAGPTLWPGTSGELPNFRSLDHLYITTAQYSGKLDPMSEEEFARDWLSKDLTLAAGRGIPEKYKVWNNQLYVLPAPKTALTFLAHYHQRVSALTNTTPGVTDLPITPIHLDEAILTAAKIRCHKRAQELTLAAAERADLEEFFDDMKDDEAEIENELQERVAPDNTWL
jgi:hypothetical protein